MSVVRIDGRTYTLHPVAESQVWLQRIPLAWVRAAMLLGPATDLLGLTGELVGYAIMAGDTAIVVLVDERTRVIRSVSRA